MLDNPSLLTAYRRSPGLGETGVQRTQWTIFLGAGFLVSVPVFCQAPLVRFSPWLGLGSTLLWFAFAQWLGGRPKMALWGELLWGFGWSWLAGAIYWGWFRHEPFYHLPIEALAVPWAIVDLWRKKRPIAHGFYLGSLLGTAITDLYFYLLDLFPLWRQLMEVEQEPQQAAAIFQQAVSQIATPWGISWAIVWANVLLGMSLAAIGRSGAAWYAFAGAVIFTLLVDGLFAILACVSL